METPEQERHTYSIEEIKKLVAEYRGNEMLLAESIFGVDNCNSTTA
jgi:hypothetical protein